MCAAQENINLVAYGQQFLMVLEAVSPGSQHQQIWYMVGSLFWKVTDDLMMEGTGLVSLTSSLISGPSHLPAVPQPNTIILG